jgi:hypothetical protein
MFGFSSVRFNFYPLGRRTGPVNSWERYGRRNNVIARTWHVPAVSTRKNTPRTRLALQCPLCSFQWDHDTLTVFCPVVNEHRQRESWLSPDWFWRRDGGTGTGTPPMSYKFIKASRNPRTGLLGADAWAKSNNNERRGQGLTTKMRFLSKEQRVMSHEQSGIGSFSNHWLTHFPFPG